MIKKLLSIVFLVGMTHQLYGADDGDFAFAASAAEDHADLLFHPLFLRYVSL